MMPADLFGGVTVVASPYAPEPTYTVEIHRNSFRYRKRKRWSVRWRVSHRYLFDGNTVYVHPLTYSAFLRGEVPANATEPAQYTGPRPVAPSTDERVAAIRQQTGYKSHYIMTHTKA